MTDIDMPAGTTGPGQADQETPTSAARGLGAEASRVLEVLAAWNEPAPVPVVAALTDLTCSSANRHLRHLVRCGVAERSSGGYLAAAEAADLVTPAVIAGGWVRAARWCLVALFEAASVLGVVALPEDEPPLVPGCPPPHLPDRLAAADWYTASYSALSRVLREASSSGLVESAWHIALLMLNIDAALGPGPAWQGIAELGFAAAQRAAEPVAEAMIGEYRGKLMLACGEIEDARTLQEQVWAWRAAAGDERGVARSFNALGLVELRAGDLAAAEPLFRKALTCAEALEFEEFATYARLNLGAVLARTGAPGEAKDLLNEAIDALRAGGRAPYEADGLRTLAGLHRCRGHLELARDLIDRAVEVASRAGLPVYLAAVLTDLAAVQKAEGDLLAGLASLREARLIYLELGDELRAEQVATEILAASEAYGSN
ncbi:MAG TPA: tetratricopeptide repeat protein [Actinospica sp.]|jgi:tetratricopeptide (TPR) repeat protein|nr:tetratricopeptide repeat protein [Actinospica sp.]